MVEVTVGRAGAGVVDGVSVRLNADMFVLAVIVEVVVEDKEISGRGVVCDEFCANTPPVVAAFADVWFSAAFALGSSMAAAGLLAPLLW